MMKKFCGFTMINAVKKRFKYQSLSRLCDDTGISRNIAYRLMNGNGDGVGLTSLNKLSNALEISLSELISMGEK